jgi:hypothetical protein
MVSGLGGCSEVVADADTCSTLGGSSTMVCSVGYSLDGSSSIVWDSVGSGSFAVAGSLGHDSSSLVKDSLGYDSSSLVKDSADSGSSIVFVVDESYCCTVELVRPLGSIKPATVSEES